MGLCYNYYMKSAKKVLTCAGIISLLLFGMGGCQFNNLENFQEGNARQSNYANF